MEKDNEVKGNGNSYDFGARMQDPRLGRWLSVDKKWNLNLAVTPYGFGNNNPLFYKDKGGYSIDPVTEDDEKEYNLAIAKTFTGNDFVIGLLSINEKNHSLSYISKEDYSKAMASLNTVDEKAAFRGLYLVANDELKYKLSVKEAIVNYQGTTEYVNTGPSMSTNEETGDIDVLAKKPKNTGGILDKYASTASWTKKNGKKKSKGSLTTLKNSSVILGALVGSYVILNQESSVVNDNMSDNLSFLQSVNIFQQVRTNNKLNAYAINGGEFTSKDESVKSSNIPSTIKYIVTWDVRTLDKIIIDETKVGNKEDTDSK